MIESVWQTSNNVSWVCLAWPGQWNSDSNALQCDEILIGQVITINTRCKISLLFNQISADQVIMEKMLGHGHVFCSHSRENWFDENWNTCRSTASSTDMRHLKKKKKMEKNKKKKMEKKQKRLQHQESAIQYSAPTLSFWVNAEFANDSQEYSVAPVSLLYSVILNVSKLLSAKNYKFWKIVHFQWFHQVQFQALCIDPYRAFSHVASWSMLCGGG